MSVGLYMDHHIPAGITVALRARGVDVATAAEDGAARFEDPRLLDRATALSRVLVTQDEHLIIEAVRRQRTGETFAGLIYGSELSGSHRRTIDDLQLIAQLHQPQDTLNQIFHLPI